jgi:ribosomal protein L16 Arg81 hydroxylase
LRLRPFDRTAAPNIPVAPPEDAAVPVPAAPMAAPIAPSSQAQEIAALKLALGKREWLLETLERQRSLVSGGTTIERRTGMGAQEFLEQYYAPARPVLLGGEMDDWPALTRWTPGYLQTLIGSALVEYQGGRNANARFEMDKDRHRRTGPFDNFIDAITGVETGNDAYITAYNSARNQEALALLTQDMGFLDKFLTRDAVMPDGIPWIGSAGTVTSLHHDLTNNFIAQLVGRKQITVLPAAEVGRIYNHHHVFSQISDLDDPDLDMALFPRLADTTAFNVVLEAGEILFMPLGWWHQVRALDFSVTVTFTNFHWPNDGYASYPTG